MSLEHKLRPQAVIRRMPGPEVLEALRQGKKFIVVDRDFDTVPFGYAMIDMMYRGDSFRTLVPQSLLFYMANPGEGDSDDALDEISDFYDEVKGFEHGLMEDSARSVQGANWATLARNAYEVYLINKLTKGGEGNPDVFDFDDGVLEGLGLKDDYVAERAKAIAAIALDKSPENVKKYGLRSVLRHVTVRERVEEELPIEEFDAVACWAGSHYEIRDEYRSNPDVEYQIDCRHDKEHKAGKRIVHQRSEEFLDKDISRLEGEIASYRSQNGGIGRHDANLTRVYINLAHIAQENHRAQLPIQPKEIEE